jgi:hypothetical protein
MFIEYLFFMIIFKVEAGGIGEKAHNLYEIVKETPQFSSVLEVLQPLKVKNFVRDKIVGGRETQKKEGDKKDQ